MNTASSGSPTIRAYRPGDERALVELWEEVFGHPMTEEHWRWKLKHVWCPVENVGLAGAASGDGVRAAACELVLEALVAQKRISRSSAGYARAPQPGPEPGKGYQGLDPIGGLNI